MFSSLKFELVKALHESDDGYVADESFFSEYDNVIGECYEKYFVAGCLYQNGDIKIPCFGCQEYYRTPKKYFLTTGIDKHDNKTMGFRVVDENGFGFWHVHQTKEDAINEAIEVFEILRIQIQDNTVCPECKLCGCC